MLTSVRIESFRSVNAAQLPLRPFTCLVGPNNSGRSDPIDGPLFLRDAERRGTQRAWSERANLSTLPRLGLPESPEVKISAVFDPSPLPGYRAATGYELVVDARSGICLREFVKATGEGGQEYLAATAVDSPPQGHHTEIKPLRPGWGGPQKPTRASKGMPSERIGVEPVRAAASFLGRTEGYRFSPEVLKQKG